jgi:hypothetical protein
MVSVVQREWAAKNPRATFKAPITVEDVLNSRMIAYPVPAVAVLFGDRSRRRVDLGVRRARQGFPAKLAPGMNRGRSTCSAPARVSRRRWSPHPSFSRKRESRGPQRFRWLPWTPALRGGDERRTSSRAFCVADARISVYHGVGGMFAACGTIIMSNQPP